MEGAAYSAICDATFMSRRAIRVACPEAQEGSKTNKTLEENKTQCMFKGLKSHCMGLLPCKEKR